MRIKVIESYEALQDLAPAWEKLWERCPSATPFQSPDWQLPWWRHFGAGELKTLALFDGADRENLAGIWPLSIGPPDSGPGGPSRTAVMNGLGVSDYLDILIAPESAAAGTVEAVQVLLESADWDCCDFQEIREESPLLKAAFSDGTAVEVQVMQVCPAVSLPEAKETYLAGLPRKHRRSLRRAGRLIEKRGGIAIETVGEGTVPEFLDELFDLHGERWSRRDQPGVLRGEAVRAFHREVAAAMFGKGRLRMYRMRREGKTLSVLYLFTAGRKTFCYLGGFDPAEEQLSPGAVIIGHAINEAISEGMTEFDFLRGNEAYKYLWGCRDHQNYRILIEKK